MSIDTKPVPPPQQHHHPNDHHLLEEDDDSISSSPMGDGDDMAHAPPGSHPPSAGAANNATSQDGQQPKRKGGRKPIYATSEERKQRNRQAQAAFRERRTEYIKQLEETIRVHETNLHSLQTAHRNAADECLMLRYKNSLLERILLEKGIDVQSELNAKTGGSDLGATHMPQNLVQPPPIQRALINRHHHSRRSNSGIAPKSDPAHGIGQGHITSASPKTRPTPSSHSNSPTNPVSGFSPAASDNLSVRGAAPGLPRPHIHGMPVSQPQQHHQPQQTHRSQPPPRRPAMRQTPSVGNGAAYYPTPGFQTHLEQLEQEYDAPPDVAEESDIETPSGPGPYAAGNFANEGPQLLSPASNGPGHVPHQHHEHQPSSMNGGQTYPSMTSLLDHQNMDWDPFGLSASMAFPSQSYQVDPSVR
ncbi:MEAB protein [Emericellopsis atlantica]|uniref:MEAB protein n=1 Tax=Emericellopsis atlantica TaxID=2614577 RepID=A0A9P7ZT64_9HYPO|nr:MEAB protein [Emericellopsis atlantica]KAG9257225.1 MEAB protein [Emericellopsis atlantica]